MSWRSQARSRPGESILSHEARSSPGQIESRGHRAKKWARRLPARPIPPLIKQVLVPVPGMIVISGSNRKAEWDGRAVIQRDQVIVGSRRQRPQVEVELPETMRIGQRR